MNKPLLRVAAILAIASFLLAACLPAEDTSAPTAPATSVPAAAATSYPADANGPTPDVNASPSAYPPPDAAPATGPNSGTYPYPPAGSSPSTSPAVGVNIGQNTTLGNILVDNAGMTLYVYGKDSPGASTCTSACLTNWPPLLATSAVTAGAGLDPTLFATAQTTDGRAMVTYKGAPLYHYKGDINPGDTNGNGVGGVWSVVKP